MTSFVIQHFLSKLPIQIHKLYRFATDETKANLKIGCDSEGLLVDARWVPLLEELTSLEMN